MTIPKGTVEDTVEGVAAAGRETAEGECSRTGLLGLAVAVSRKREADKRAAAVFIPDLVTAAA